MAAVQHINAQVKDADKIAVGEGQALKQKALSRAIDDAIMQDLIDGGDAHLKAHYNLVGCEGAGAWLFAMASRSLGLELQSRFFIMLLQRWLRLEIFEKEFLLPPMR